jgi:hypothetical protein
VRKRPEGPSRFLNDQGLRNLTDWSHRGVKRRSPACRPPLPVSRDRPRSTNRKPSGPQAPTACRRLPSRVHKQHDPRSTGLSKIKPPLDSPHLNRCVRPARPSPPKAERITPAVTSTLVVFTNGESYLKRAMQRGQQRTPGFFFANHPFTETLGFSYFTRRHHESGSRRLWSKAQSRHFPGGIPIDMPCSSSPPSFMMAARTDAVPSKTRHQPALTPGSGMTRFPRARKRSASVPMAQRTR